MKTMQSVLLYGSYAWQSDRQPVGEFDRRLAATRDLMRRSRCDALLVHGDSRENASLCYLTNFVPNQRWGLALIDPERPVRLIAPVGPRDLPAVKPLTWVSDVHASSDVRAPLQQWLAEAADRAGRKAGSLTIGIDGLEEMRADLGRTVDQTCREFGELLDASADMRSLRADPAPADLASIRECHRLLQTGFQEIEGRRQFGAPFAAALIAGERVIRLAGAQDVRILGSIGGSGRLLPLSDAASEGSAEPWTVYLAARYCGYWTDAVTTLASSRPPISDAVRHALGRALDTLRPGMTGPDLARVLGTGFTGIHSVLGRNLCRAHGLSLDGQPWMTIDSEEAFVMNRAYLVVAGANGADGSSVLESATIILDQPQGEIRWPTPA